MGSFRHLDHTGEVGVQVSKRSQRAMRCAANFAWAYRRCITHWTRQSFQQVFGKRWEAMGMVRVYDVSHNIAKIEEHTVDGKTMSLCVHRKGATRSFPPGERGNFTTL